MMRVMCCWCAYARRGMSHAHMRTDAAHHSRVRSRVSSVCTGTAPCGSNATVYDTSLPHTGHIPPLPVDYTQQDTPHAARHATRSKTRHHFSPAARRARHCQLLQPWPSERYLPVCRDPALPSHPRPHRRPQNGTRRPRGCQQRHSVAPAPIVSHHPPGPRPHPLPHPHLRSLHRLTSRCPMNCVPPHN